jgi:hypothetical protein
VLEHDGFSLFETVAVTRYANAMGHRYNPAAPDNEREWHKSVRCSTTTVGRRW